MSSDNGDFHGLPAFSPEERRQLESEVPTVGPWEFAFLLLLLLAGVAVILGAGLYLLWVTGVI